MKECRTAFVGIDVAKSRNAIAVAEGERGGEVRYHGAATERLRSAAAS